MTAPRRKSGRTTRCPIRTSRTPLAEIETNGFNLNLPRYIDSTEPEDLQDIEAHLKGGIPNRDIDGLERYWQVFPSVRGDLFTDTERPGYSQLKVEASQIKTSIFEHPEFTAFNQRVTDLLDIWRQANTLHLTGLKQGDRTKALIWTLSENLLETFRQDFPGDAPLIDPYDVYQHLMDYWAETLQDDAYQIIHEGWQAVIEGQPNTDLIPSALIIARYFTTEQAAIEQLEAECDAISRQMEEMDEEHGGEDGLLNDARTDKGRLTAKSVKDRLKVIALRRVDKRSASTNQADDTAADERTVLEAYAALMQKETAAKKRVKDAQKALDTKVAAKYGQLTQAEIKTLVLDNKWLAALEASVQGELDRVSQALTGRIKELTERYAPSLPALTYEVETMAALVEAHLKKMGVV